VALSFARVRPSAAGVGAGIITGIATLAAFAAAKTSVIGGINVGIVALGANAAVTIVVGYAIPVFRLRAEADPTGS
jgi:hypothetical protein